MIRSHYDNLQVARNASDTVIRAAYKGLAQKYHPDRFEGDPAVAERIMKLLNEAYAVLSDPVRRKEHDKWLDEQQDMKDKGNLDRTAASQQQSDSASATDEKRKKSILNFDLDRVWPYLMQRPALTSLICTGYLFFVARKPKGSISELVTPGGFGVFLGLVVGLGAFAWVVWFVLSRIAPQALAQKRASTLSLTMAITTLALLIGNSVK